ncbi:MAG TPA: non-canonical purine NTP pyrophosphatase, partial [Vicinamibacterales bacterium]
MIVLLGTTNPDKLREMRRLLDELPIEFRPLTTYPTITEAEETGTTYSENARLKGLHYARQTGLPTIAEDSGFEVDVLDREPGVVSARFLGATATYPQRFDEIYRRVRARGATGSTARFVCALVLATPEGIRFETRQTVEGDLAPEPRGSKGFGYDPIFLYPPFGKTLGEVEEIEKSNVSHRGKAVRAVREFLRQYLGRT